MKIRTNKRKINPSKSPKNKSQGLNLAKVKVNKRTIENPFNKNHNKMIPN